MCIFTKYEMIANVFCMRTINQSPHLTPQISVVYYYPRQPQKPLAIVYCFIIIEIYFWCIHLKQKIIHTLCMYIYIYIYGVQSFSASIIIIILLVLILATSIHTKPIAMIFHIFAHLFFFFCVRSFVLHLAVWLCCCWIAVLWCVVWCTQHPYSCGSSEIYIYI